MADPQMEQNLSLECPWFHVDSSIPSVQWHYAKGFMSGPDSLCEYGKEKNNTTKHVNERKVQWTCLKSTISPQSSTERKVETKGIVFFQCHGSTVDVYCMEKNELPLDRLSLEFSDDEEVSFI